MSVAQNKQKLVVISIGAIVGLLLIGGALYAYLPTLQPKKTADEKTTTSSKTTTKVTSATLQQGLKTTSELDKNGLDARVNTQKAIDEKPVKVVK